MNKIKNSQNSAKTKQKPGSIKSIDNYPSDATIDSGWGSSQPLSGFLSNSEDTKFSLQLVSCNKKKTKQWKKCNFYFQSQEKRKQSENPKNKNKVCTFRIRIFLLQKQIFRTNRLKSKRAML